MNGRKIRLLTVLGEYTRKCLAIEVGYHLTSNDVLETLSKLFINEGIPHYIRSENGSEFKANNLRKWLKALQDKTDDIEPGSHWENGYHENEKHEERERGVRLGEHTGAVEYT